MNTHLILALMLASSFYSQLLQAMEHPEVGEKRSIPAFSSYPCKMLKITNEKPVNVMKELNSCLRNISHSIHQAHQEADAATIEKAYANFSELSKTYGAEDWHRAKQTLTQWIHPSYVSTLLYQWPAQKTDQEIIGGHLFYPPALNDLLDCPNTEDLIQRKDYVFALAAAAHHHHSLAHYYLIRTLEDLSLVNYSEMNEEDRTFFHDHYREVLEELEKHCQDHPDACYVLGTNYNRALFARMSVVKYDSLKAYEFFTKGGDARNKLAALELKQHDIIDFPVPPTVQENLALGRESRYGPAYISAADLVEELEEDEEKKLSYLQEALQLPYYPALIELGYVYQEKSDKEKALHYFVEAGKKGIPEGYIEAGSLIGGDFPPLTLRSKKEYEALAALSDDQVTQAQTYFETAGKAHDPQGWAYLAEYCITLLIPDALQGHQEREQEFRKQALKAIEQGIRLGSPRCFGMAQAFPEHYGRLVKIYGPVTYGAYYKYIENKFLK